MPADGKHTRYFCLHGHFYQPPRENPVTGRVELQPSAAPYHDWNERIFEECYAPNASSRILDEKGRIRRLVNNFGYMSFNVGPTLFNWIQESHPSTYARVLEGDRASCERLEGHGNAIAQVYNHVIMPLASEEEQRLQVKWGIADFEMRFGRRPEGMWLSETAVNASTVCALIREGIKFTVLSPTQALKVRPLNGETWTDVSRNSINPRQPYRVFPLAKDGAPLEKGYLDVFFYDGPLSLGVGFEHLLRDANVLGQRILGAFDSGDDGPQLVSVCTDGESYGHHEPFGDMCAAYLFDELGPRLGLEPVSYAWYLANFPPRHEVRLKNFHGEGTAWSCAHGLGRWKSDCGCTAGGQPDWNQKWRAPLRRALERLDARASAAAAEMAPGLFRDWRAAQDGAVLSWQGDLAQRRAWFEAQLGPGTDPVKAMRLLDVLRFTHFSFTSCAWFFADLSGIETQQNLRYAMRVLHLLEDLGLDGQVRKEFLSILSQARSNYNSKTGDTLFLEMEAEALPVELHLALDQWTARFSQEPPECLAWPSWSPETSSESSREGRTGVGYVFVHQVSGEARTAALLYEGDGVQSDSFSYYCGPGRRTEEGMEKLLTGHLVPAQSPDPPSPEAGVHIGALPLRSFPMDVKDRIGNHLNSRFWKDSGQEIAQWEARILDTVENFRCLGWPLPESICGAREIIDNFHLVQRILNGVDKEDPEDFRQAHALAQKLRKGNVSPRLGPARHKLHLFSGRLGRVLTHDPKNFNLELLFALLDLVDALNLNLSARFRLENFAFPLLRGLDEGARTGVFTLQMDPKEAILLLDRLNFNTDFAKSVLETSRSTAT